MTLDRLVHELSAKKREEALQDAKVVVIRSQEIDGIGENIPGGVAQKIMGHYSGGPSDGGTAPERCGNPPFRYRGRPWPPLRRLQRR